MHRQTGAETPCFPPSRPAPIGGRYHAAGDPWPLYASLEPATAWAEWRAATGGAIDPSAERRRLWRVDVRDLTVLDLRDGAVRGALRVEPRDLVRGRGPCQALAKRAERLGVDGMVVPSAAHPGAWNLVVFPRGFGAITAAGSSLRNPAPPPAG